MKKVKIEDLKVGMLVKHKLGFIGQVTEVDGTGCSLRIKITDSNFSEYQKGYVYHASVDYVVEILGYHIKDGITVGDTVEEHYFGHVGVVKSINSRGSVALKLTEPKTQYGIRNKDNYTVGTDGLVKIEDKNSTNVSTNIVTSTSIEMANENNDSYEVEFEMAGMIVRMDYKNFIKFVTDVQEMNK